MKMRFLLMFCAFVLIASQSGCVLLAAGAAGVGTAKWLNDKVSQEIEKPKKDVADTVKAVFNDLHLKVTKESSTDQVTQFLAKYDDGRQVWVDVHVVSVTTSRVEVRVGWINGEADAHSLLEEIVKKSKRWF